MTNINEWVKEVFMVILSITFVQIMLPAGNLEKYAKFIYSIIILAVILSPLAGFAHK